MEGDVIKFSDKLREKAKYHENQASNYDSDMIKKHHKDTAENLRKKANYADGNNNEPA